jgi:hypothetical protein
MSVEVNMQMTAKQAHATEHLLKTFSRFGMMLPYLVLGELVNPMEDGYPVFRIVIRIVGEKQIYRIEVNDGDEDA